jgi:hypothetical protein
MMFAEHVIGLSARELGAASYRGDEQVLGVVRERFAQVLQDGYLRPRGETPLTLEHVGSLTDLDALAADNQYVFLSAGSRYRENRGNLAYGFVFNAADLVRRGALVGKDMLSDYSDLAGEIATEMASHLPPPTPLSAEEIAEFAARFDEDDADVLAYVQDNENEHYYRIMDALLKGKQETEEERFAVQEFSRRVRILQSHARKTGAAALRLLTDCTGSVEILWPGSLPLSWSVGLIRGGEVEDRP